MRILLLALAAPAVLLSACADGAGLRPALDIGPSAESGSSYGLFLSAQKALNDGDGATAANLYKRAQQQGLSPAFAQEREFTAALLGGDIPRAAKLAPSGETASPAMERMGLLTRAVEDMATGKGKSAYAILSGPGVGFPHGAARSLLLPWAAAQAGQTEASLARPQAENDKLVEAFGLLAQAHLFERARRYDEAETDFKTLPKGDGLAAFQLAYGEFLERRGRRDEAIAVYDAALLAAPGYPELVAARARAEAKQPAPAAPEISAGAAQGLLAASAAMMQMRQPQLAQAYLRLVLRLQPERDEAWLMLGEVLAQNGDETAAREAYAKLKPTDPDYISARSKLAWSYQRAGDKDRAIAIAREAHQLAPERGGGVVLAELLRAGGELDEALALMTTALQRQPRSWRIRFARATVLEQMGRWPEAEADLKAALLQAPDEPELLNYLGYSWIDRGVHLDEAIAMVQRAVAAEPDSAAMIDSVGWGYYRKGDLKNAQIHLEKAVEMMPGNPEINDHLGDLYWRMGRRLEAEFQWRRVLTLEPDDKIKARAELKIKNGLGKDGQPGQSPLLAGP